MYLFFLGSLYFHVVINTVGSSDPYFLYEAPEELPDIENCTECNVKPARSCFCFENIVGNVYVYSESTCLICCTLSQCCYCDDCTICQQAEWQLMTMTHVSITILFVLGITGLIIVYCKICHRTRRMARCILVQEEHNAMMHCSTVEGLRERPPAYSEVCGAPPLYTSPYNRASMQEAPPMYPGSPKSQERSRGGTNDISAPSTQSVVAQHM